MFSPPSEGIRRARADSGNAFLYVLIAIILFGALMFAISRSSDRDGSTSELDESRAKVAANEILGYASSVMNAITQMQASAAQNSELDFILPDDANFNTDTPANPNIRKLFHPSGGGLNYKPLPTDAVEDDGANPPPAYYVGRFNTIEWTPSTTPDIVFVAYKIKTSVCEEINLKLRGNTTIPTVAGDSLENLFIDASLHAGANAPFNVANCGACEEIPALCVQNAGGKKLFYSILEAE